MRRSTGKAGTAPEALPKETKMPRCASELIEMSSVFLPMPSMTAWHPAPPVTSMTLATMSTAS